MVIPKIKRFNTIGVRYIKGEIKEDHYVKVIEEILCIQEDEIAGLCQMGKKRFFVKVTTAARYDYLCDLYGGQEVIIDEDNTVIIDDVSTYKTRIKVKGVPWEFPNELLRSLLERYGRVDSIIDCSWRAGKYKGVPNDEKIVWMVVDDPIPSSLFITETNCNFQFSYDKQPFTCHKS